LIFRCWPHRLQHRDDRGIELAKQRGHVGIEAALELALAANEHHEICNAVRARALADHHSSVTGCAGETQG
jgi:hypothetical protein